MSKEAMKLALDHLMNLQPILGNGLLEDRQLAFIDPHIDCAITALQEGLAEQPAQRKPLTDDEITSLWEKRPYFNDFARAIEAAHGIKENT